jgi:hypothetical protein
MILRLGEFSLLLGFVLFCVSFIQVAVTFQMDIPPIMWVGTAVATPGTVIIFHKLFRDCRSSNQNV